MNSAQLNDIKFKSKDEKQTFDDSGYTLNLCKSLEYCIKEGIVDDAIKLVYELANLKEKLLIRPFKDDITDGLYKVSVYYKSTIKDLNMHIKKTKVSELKQKV